MAETPQEIVDRELREFKRYTGDGLPGEPVNAPLPVGDPPSGVHNPKKKNLRNAMKATLEGAGEAVGDAEDQASYAQEWAQSPNPISVEAGGDGASDRSSKWWAENSEDSADRAETYAAMLSVDRVNFNTVAALLADTSVGYAGSGASIIAGPGDIITAQGFRYEVVASEASGAWLIETAGGVKLEVAGIEPELAAFGAVNDRITSNDSAFAKLRAHAIEKGLPAFVRGRGYLLTEEQQLEEGLWLFAVDGGFVFTDDTLRSGLYVGNDNITLDNIEVEMPETFTSGAVGFGVLVKGSSGARLRKVMTNFGKMGIGYLDADDIVLDDCLVRRSARWGFIGSGIRGVVHNRCRVEITTDTTANDCFKLVGKLTGFSTRSTYNVWYNDCYGEGAGAGQVLDIICDNDEVDDIHHVYVNNIHGKGCKFGLLEIKTGDTVGTAYMHSIFVDGGTYVGNGDELTGIYITRRVDNVTVANVKISDVLAGIAATGPGRRVRVIDCEFQRCREDGVQWGLTGSENKLIRPVVYDANWGQAASTYSGITLLDTYAINNFTIEDPIVGVSSVPSTFPHRYGIQFGDDFVNVAVKGRPSLLGHANAPTNRAGSGVIEWPETIKSGVIDIAASGSASSEIFGSHEHGFQACAVSITYAQASNVARTVTVSGRGTGGGTSVSAPSTSSSAAIAQRDLTQLSNPVALQRTRQCFQWALGAVTLPGSPTGKIIVEVHGYRDGAVLA